MKKIIILVFTMLAGYHLNSQNLLDIYKSGEVHLIPDQTYAAGNDWENLFAGYYDELMGRQVGNQKRIVVATDGSVFMSHKNHHQIWKFDPNGSLAGKFGEYGGKPHQFPMLPSVQSIVEGKYFLTSDVNSRLKLFDLDGNYQKSLSLDYMTNSIQSLGNNKLLVCGSVLWKEGWREIVSIIDINTQEEKIIHSYFRDRGNVQTRTITAGNDTVRFFTITYDDDLVYMPSYQYFTKHKTVLLENGNFVLANGKTGNVNVYNTDGKPINEFMLDIIPLEITGEDVSENYQKALESNRETIKRINENEHWSDEIKQEYRKVYDDDAEVWLGKIKDLSNYYPNLPYYSNVIIDNEGNMLVFEYTRKDEDVDNRFAVIAFNNRGEKLAQTSFICTEYELKISDATLKYHNGYIYAVCEEKGTDGIPLRLVRFKLQNTPGQDN
ncbi:MAG: hypothetical protein JSV24_00620 [Bacteroidales bacterium]|nr:MAG: hypothetical protein JSV24_00620 [Bacteroidales bacterium]